MENVVEVGLLSSESMLSSVSFISKQMHGYIHAAH
jgi:hypothetical protein